MAGVFNSFTCFTNLITVEEMTVYTDNTFLSEITDTSDDSQSSIEIVMTGVVASGESPYPVIVGNNPLFSNTINVTVLPAGL